MISFSPNHPLLFLPLHSSRYSQFICILGDLQLYILIFPSVALSHPQSHHFLYRSSETASLFPVQKNTSSYDTERELQLKNSCHQENLLWWWIRCPQTAYRGWNSSLKTTASQQGLAEAITRDIALKERWSDGGWCMSVCLTVCVQVTWGGWLASLHVNGLLVVREFSKACRSQRQPRGGR